MNGRLVEILVFEGCPNGEVTVARARDAIERTKVPADVRIVRVESEVEAQRLRFLGSPTVRVDGIDVEEVARERDDFGLQCRVYFVAGRHDGAPPSDWIAAALRGGTRDDEKEGATHAHSVHAARDRT